MDGRCRGIGSGRLVETTAAKDDGTTSGVVTRWEQPFTYDQGDKVVVVYWLLLTTQTMHVFFVGQSWAQSMWSTLLPAETMCVGRFCLAHALTAQ